MCLRRCLPVPGVKEVMHQKKLSARKLFEMHNHDDALAEARNAYHENIMAMVAEKQKENRLQKLALKQLAAADVDAGK